MTNKTLPGGKAIGDLYRDKMNMRINIKPKKQTSEGIDALEILAFEELCDFVAIKTTENSAAGRFILSLMEAYILMVNRIVERNPEARNFRNPATYPEFEIYDSVHAILEDDEVESIASSAGISENPWDTVKKISDDFYYEINNLFCVNSDWDPFGLRKKPDKIVMMKAPEGIPKWPTNMDDLEEFTKQVFQLTHSPEREDMEYEYAQEISEQGNSNE